MYRKGYNRIEEIIMFGIEKLKEEIEKYQYKTRQEHTSNEWDYYSVYGRSQSTHSRIEERLNKIEKFIHDLGYVYRPESTTPAKWVKKSNTAKK